MAPAVGVVGPINRALGLLGTRRGQHRDAFDALGLDRYRHFDDLYEKD